MARATESPITRRNVFAGAATAAAAAGPFLLGGRDLGGGNIL
jgi:hypothetical protein